MRETQTSVDQIEFVVRTIAATACANEKYFGDCDAVVGDGDFGYSLARGFEEVLKNIDAYERTSGGTFLKKVALTVTGKTGGTSGPLWGTALLRAAAVAADKPELNRADAVAMLRAACAGIAERGRSARGDKTLLDALIPATDALEADSARLRGPAAAVLERVAAAARAGADETKTMIAKCGRAAYAGERSIGSVDAGAVAIAHMFEDLRDAYRARG